MTLTDASPSYVERPAKFVAGAIGLDFLNTVEWRGRPGSQSDRLTSYGELLAWSVQAGLLPVDEAARLEREAMRHPRRGRAVLKAAIALREAAAAAVMAEGAPALEGLNDALSGARFMLGIERSNDGLLRPASKALVSSLAQPFVLIAREVVDALTIHRLPDIRHCANANCGWFFLDLSKNKTRRWCQMATCGNQAKAREHYARARRGAGRPRTRPLL